MKKLFYIIILTVLSYISKSQTKHLLGIGLGFDYLGYDPKDPPEFYSNKDINISFNLSSRYFCFETRQGFRFDDFFDDALKSSTYVMIGFTTLTEKRLFFNMLIGGSFSFLLNKNEPPAQYYYPPQISPVVKSGLSFRVIKSKALYLGIDALISTFHYSYDTGSSGTSGSITGSALFSVNYLFTNTNKE